MIDMWYLYLIPWGLFIFIVWAIVHGGKKTYTTQEWEEQCEKDFKKYGPVPDDLDEDPYP